MGICYNDRNKNDKKKYGGTSSSNDNPPMISKQGIYSK